MIKYYFSILIFSISSFGFSQQEKDSITIPKDTNQVVSSRSFNKELKNKYSSEEFNYDVATGESQNLLARFLNWIFKGLRNTFGINIPPNMLKIIEYFIYILMGGLALYLLIKFIVGENLSSVFSKKANSIIDINLSEEHIENIDLESLIRAALEQKDYRLAIRYHYLKALKNLSQKGIIEWEYEKTNSDYQKEIETPNIKSIFKEVSYLYDYIWYGEQPIDKIKYEAAQSRFAALKNLLPR
ncbi:hypothetical protein GGR42_000951 [Saonia flava]|uniref:DUF4129 domain-containing protein n=1 Tax=Saonia flava TaxID=523696 RepID=A0A846R0V0_9FLAO|nr:hypothetical protein [Saonia flava]NJB70489.1 hypothetical protein [Saonia flava]